MRLAGVGLLALVLVGCGGSGNDSSTARPSGSGQSVLKLIGDLEVLRGESVALTVLARDDSALSDVRWSFPDPTYSPLAKHTQAIGFDATVSGDYLINVFATLPSGEQVSESYTLTVVEAERPEVVLRLAQQATEGGRVSLQLDINKSTAVTDIQWTQLQGTAAVDVRYDELGEPSRRVFFRAPEVTQDEVVEYQAQVTFADGTTASDSTLVVVKNADINEDGFFPGSDLIVTEHMQPYNLDSPYADALEACVYNNQVERSCSFGQLPLIGEVTESPTVDDILDRTLVSHPWMGDALRDFLNYSDTRDDLLQMLRATTAIVISYEVRPSFYWAATGAIYLDADNFWRTPEERDTVNTEPDYRSDFGLELNYLTTWRYVKDGDYFYPQPGLAAELRNTRTLLGIERSIAWLLYHELAHANDFFPYTSWSSMSSTQSPLSYVNRVDAQSYGLTASYPLTSQLLFDLAEVNYGGAPPTEEQIAVSAEEVGMEFEQDGAGSFYSYYTGREDYAILVERFMMLYRLGASTDVGVFSADALEEGTYAVTWGQRDRINDILLQSRVKYALNRIFPDMDVEAVQQQLPVPQMLPYGESWFDVLSLNESASAANYLLWQPQVSTLLPERRHVEMPLPLAHP